MPNEEINIIIEETVEEITVEVNETVEEITVVVSEGISNHSQLVLDDGTNPHGTTKTDVGLSNVPNLDTTNAVNDSHTHSNKSTLDLITEAFTTLLKNNYDSAYNWVSINGASLLNHLTNFANPHNVTKSQVGLSNVDNTSDLNKPISTATQTALNLKLNISDLSAGVLSVLLSSLSLSTGGSIVSTDSVLVAFGKLQKQINDLSSVFVPLTRTITINGSTQNLSSDISFNETILGNLGVWVKFNQAAAGHYPFTGAGLNSGTIQGSSVNYVNEYTNSYVRFQATSGATNSGYRFTDGNSFPTIPFKGLTFFAIINPIVTTNLSAIIGMPFSSSLTTITENTTNGLWFNITGNQIRAKTAYSGGTTSAPAQTITATEWLLCMIEVIENNAIDKIVRFKVKKIDGTIVYNEDMNATIQPYNVGVTTCSTGVRAVLTSTAGSNTDILGLQAIGFWANKPSFLNNF